jgi:hypothetical protein
MRQTPFTDDWKATKLAPALQPDGRKADLARALGGDFAFRKVQISKILNTNRVPDAEFVLAFEAWLATLELPTVVKPLKKKRRR